MAIYLYTDTDMPEIEIVYEVFPGSPAFDDDIEIQGFFINGEKVSLKLESHLVEYFDFENKIKEGLNV